MIGILLFFYVQIIVLLLIYKDSRGSFFAKFLFFGSHTVFLLNLWPSKSLFFINFISIIDGGGRIHKPRTTQRIGKNNKIRFKSRVGIWNCRVTPLELYTLTHCTNLGLKLPSSSLHFFWSTVLSTGTMADLAAAFAAAHADTQVLQEDVEPTVRVKPDAGPETDHPIQPTEDVDEDDAESSVSDSEDSSSESESEGSEEDRETLYNEVNAGIAEDSDAAQADAIPSFPKTKNEILPHETGKRDEDPQTIVLEDEMTIEKVGVVMNIVDDTTVLVQTQDNGQTPLDQGSILCVLREKDQSRLPLGSVDEIFGPIGKPLYVVRVARGCEEGEEVLQLLKGNPGTAVYSVKEMAKVIDPNKLDTRGSDASNRYDEEVDDTEQDYSDDEEEARAKRARRNRRKGESADGAGNNAPRRRVRVNRRPQQQQHASQPSNAHYGQHHRNQAPRAYSGGRGHISQPPPMGYHQPGSQGQSYPPPMLQPPSAYARPGMQYNNPQFVRPPPYNQFMMGQHVMPPQQGFYGRGWPQQQYYPQQQFFRPPPMHPKAPAPPKKGQQ
jgi:H/ACA ribonucleoprotein complex non-core subunit NAF1